MEVLMPDIPSSSRPPTDYRAYRRKNDRNLAFAVVIFLVGVGGALIALIYGSSALILGLTCLLAGAGLFGLVWLILTLMERWAGE
jgi:fatty acid desaturase